MINETAVNKYIEINIFESFIYIVAIFSSVVLVFMRYDPEYQSVILLPVCYLVLVFFVIKSKVLSGIGGIGLVSVYAFRMCLLPVISANGNFFIGVNDADYVDHFLASVLLMCFENILVFSLFVFYCTRYNNKRVKLNEGGDQSVLLAFGIAAVVVIGYIFYTHPSFMFRFNLISHNEAIAGDSQDSIIFSGPWYFLLILLEMYAKPIIVFILMHIILKKYSKKRLLIAFLLMIANMVIVSDRRLLSVLVGTVCLLEILYNFRRKISRKIMYLFFVIMIVTVVFLCFYGEDTPIKIARKFQIYFSGPSLTAIGIKIAQNYPHHPADFFKALYNNSIFLVGLTHRLDVHSYLNNIIPGLKVWTPAMIGAMQFFGPLGFLLYIPIMKYYAYMDHLSKKTRSKTRRMAYTYLIVSMAIYLVAYQIEHLYYYMIAFGGMFNLLIYLNNKYIIKIGNSNHRLLGRIRNKTVEAGH